MGDAWNAMGDLARGLRIGSGGKNAMKRWMRCVAVALAMTGALGMSLGSAAASGEAGGGDASVRAAKALIETLLSRDYAAAEARLSDQLKGALDAQGGLQALIDAMLDSTGALTGLGEAHMTRAMDMDVVTTEAVFERGAYKIIIALDGEGVAQSLLFQSDTQTPEEPVPEGVTAEEVTVDAGTGYPLGGTLTFPEAARGKLPEAGPLPAVLLVWGSGPNGRDEAVGGNRVFAQLAHALAERGIAALRFDKRVVTYPEAAGRPDFSVKQEYIEDVLAATRLLAADPRVDPERVFILGHSQGGMLAPRFVEEGADVNGLILLAGSPRTLTDILYDQQMDALGAAADDPAARKLYDDMRAEAEAVYQGTEEQALAHPPLYGGAMSAYYLYEMQKHDPIALLTGQQTKVLVLQGDNDKQVLTEADYGRYRAALEGQPYAQLKLYPGLNHLFMPSEAQNLAEAMREYNTPARIPDEVLSDIAAFVKGQP